MSQTKEKWLQEATRAYENSRNSVVTQHRIRNPRNSLLMYFLIEVQHSLQRSCDREQDAPKLVHAIAGAIPSVRDCPLRLYNGARLRSLHKVGTAVSAIVERGLWGKYPPEDPDDDEEAAWAAQPAKQGSKASQAEAQKRAQTALKKRPPPAPTPHESQPCTAAEPGGDGDAGPPRKRRQQEYVPKKRSANYAFLICMYRGHAQGKESFGKEELMQLAEASGLADKPVFGASAAQKVMAGNVHQAYNGWSCMNTMINRSPPLVHRYSCPVRVRLTPEGHELAARLHATALANHEVQPLGLEAPAGADRHTHPLRHSCSAERPATDAFQGGAAAAPAPASQARAQRSVGGYTAGGPKGVGRPLGGTDVGGPACSAADAELQLQAVNVECGVAGLTRSNADEPSRSNGAGADVIDLADDSEDESKGGARQSSTAGVDVADAVAEVLTAAASAGHQPRHSQVHSNGNLLPAQSSCGRGHRADVAGSAPAESALVQPRTHACTGPSVGECGAPAARTNVASLCSEPSQSLKAAPPISIASTGSKPPSAQPCGGAARSVSARALAVPKGASEHNAEKENVDEEGVPARTAVRRAPCASAPARVCGEKLSASAANEACGSVRGSQIFGMSQNTIGGSQASAVTLPLSAARTSSAWKAPMLDCEHQPLAHIRVPLIPQGYCFSQVYDLVVLLDQREQFDRSVGGGCRQVAMDVHVEHLRCNGINVQLRHLPVGDMAWVARCKRSVPGGPLLGSEFMLDFIVERKGADDLVSSIKDGRYERQKILMAESGLRVPMYVVEGDLDSIQGATAMKAAKTAAVQTEVWAGFKVLRTADLADTKRLYVRLFKHLEALYSSIDASHANTECLPTFAAWQERCMENKKTTVCKIWGNMLCCLPGVGPETVAVLLKQYPSVHSMVHSLRKLSDEVGGDQLEQRFCEQLAAVQISLSRKVGMKAARVVYDGILAGMAV